MYESIFNKQKQFFQTKETLSLDVRIKALKQLKDAINFYEDELMFAMKSDFNKNESDAYLTEIGIVYNEINFHLKNLSRWTQPVNVKTPATHFGSKSTIYKEPYGVTLIISPWNYPFNLAIAPLVGALSAGNTAILKPSEHTPHVSEIITKVIDLAFPEKYVTSIEGGIETNQQLLNLPFDYIFYTGSSHVGKIVMEAASKNLTPVTLELGGKSPSIVTKDANLKYAAKRIVWGKFMNAGQTCVATDYIYVDNSVKERLIKHLKHYTHKFYNKEFEQQNYMQIINNDHFERVHNYIQGDIAYGGRSHKSKRMIEPTIIQNADFSHPAMEEEIFGPVLPVLGYDDLEKALIDIRDLPDPLALYIFTENDKTAKHVIKTIPFGGGAINDTMYHLASPYLPFGGRGNSGMGKYHGRYSFDTFSHSKSILKQTTLFDIPLRYPTYRKFQTLLKYIWK